MMEALKHVNILRSFQFEKNYIESVFLQLQATLFSICISVAVL